MRILVNFHWHPMIEHWMDHHNQYMYSKQQIVLMVRFLWKTNQPSKNNHLDNNLRIRKTNNITNVILWSIVIIFLFFFIQIKRKWRLVKTKRKEQNKIKSFYINYLFLSTHRVPLVVATVVHIAHEQCSMGQYVDVHKSIQNMQLMFDQQVKNNFHKPML
jgi:hypothetical protein